MRRTKNQEPRLLSDAVSVLENYREGKYEVSDWIKERCCVICYASNRERS
jgi:hypothetical protein